MGVVHLILSPPKDGYSQLIESLRLCNSLQFVHFIVSDQQ